ncbi:MAG: hypothetical protein HY303_11145 [Candidatus Wallbacteria bacterium]|nr:hypothetical protein [Candidatus Wallbacteria bacterium]
MPPPPWKDKLQRGLKVAGLLLLVLLVAVPIVAVGSVLLFWSDIDRGIRDAASRAEGIEPPELNGQALTMLQRKLQAVRMTLEPEPFLTISLTELNSAVNNLYNTGEMPQGLPVLRLEGEQGLLRPRVLWSGPQFAGLLVACGFSPKSALYGPVLSYLQQLQRFQLDVWIRPRAERGMLTWDVERATLDGFRVPGAFAEWLQLKVLPQGNWCVIGPRTRPLKECRMTDQGLFLKWAPASR